MTCFHEILVQDFFLLKEAQTTRICSETQFVGMWGLVVWEQRLDGAERRLVDYFDLIAGTSTGGLITAMITTPSPEDRTRPLLTAKEVTNFYQKYAAKIFPPTK